MSKEEFIASAVENNKELTIEYMKYDGTISTRTISDIHYTDEYGDGTNYINAFCHKRQERRTFKIDRIRKIEGWTPTQTAKSAKTAYQPSASYNTTSSSSNSTNTTNRYVSNAASSASYRSTPSYSSRNNKSEGCYIATMVYGSYDHPQVMILRKYRDEHLSKTLLGQLFIKFYYFTSPKLVYLLKDNQFINAKIKKLLDKLIVYINAKSYK